MSTILKKNKKGIHNEMGGKSNHKFVRMVRMQADHIFKTEFPSLKIPEPITVSKQANVDDNTHPQRKHHSMETRHKNQQADVFN